MKRSLLILLGIHLMVVASACVCHWPSDNVNYELSFDMLYETPIIVHAEVADVEEPTDWTMQQRVTFRTIRGYKGIDKPDFLFINRSYNTSCDPAFRKGVRYLLLLTMDAAELYVLFHCAGVIEMEQDTASLAARRIHLLEQLDQLVRNNGALNSVTFSNGQPIAKGEMVNGLPSGAWELYTYDGQVVYSGSFEKGIKTGTWFKFVDPRFMDGSWEYGMKPLLTKAYPAQFEKGVRKGSWPGDD